MPTSDKNCCGCRVAAVFVFVAVASAAACGCEIEPVDPSAYAAEAAAQESPGVDAPLATRPQSFTARVHACTTHWTRSCDALEERISRAGCGLEMTTDDCSALTSDMESAAARAICSEGSVAECEAACNGGRVEMCIALAQMLHAGVRVSADLNRADGILRIACIKGRTDACLQRGLWLRGTDPEEAAMLFMRACEASESDLTAATSCAEWMDLLDGHVFVPNQADKIGGLSRVCSLEESGALVPGSTVTDGSLTINYSGGACGRLKDLGMAPTGSLSAAMSSPARPAVLANPAAPKW